jgi:predicted nucleotidyltransferase
MASASKEEDVLGLILENSPLRQWHFEEILRSAKVTRVVANKWLKKFVSQDLLLYYKEKGKFPHYSVGGNNPVYYSLKRIYALELLHKSGLIPNLLSLKSAKTIILFGSFAKGDWYKDSDIDIFIYGNLSGFDKKIYESRLKRTIELHTFKDKEEIKEVKTGLIKNIINGYVIKGEVLDFAEVA